MGARRKPRLARAAADRILAVKVREHDFMGEERGPFKGAGAVGVGAADEFVLPVCKLDELGLTKLPDQFRAIA